MPTKSRPSHASAKDVRVGDFIKIEGQIVEVWGRLFVAGKDIPASSREDGWTEPHYIFETSGGFCRVKTIGDLELV